MRVKITIAVFFFAIFTQATYAQTMSNSSYTIEEGNLNSFAGKASGTNYTVTSTGGGLAPGVYSGTNYLVRANFGYGATATSSSNFTFSISNNNISFGKITAGEPIIRTSTLLISSPNSGYQVTAAENTSLKTVASATIPDTTCDSGSCTFAISGLWSSPLTYGFGYRCDNVTGSNCAQGFSQANYYKQFSNSQAKASPQVIMASTTPISQASTQISYKLNIAGSQPAGVYQNTIQYIALPSL